jgi:hypothetical protein
MEGGELTARRRPSPIGWGDIADLGAEIRHKFGATPHTQARLLRWMLDQSAVGAAFECPNLSKLSALIGCPRQSTRQAFHAMAKRGVIAAEAHPGTVRGYTVAVRLPAIRQLSLFAGPGHCVEGC